MKEIKKGKIGVNELFDELNKTLRPNIDKKEKEKIEQHLSEAQKAVGKILDDDKLAKMLIQFADAANKTLKLSIPRIKEEENIALLVKMMAYILATLENRKFININY